MREAAEGDFEPRSHTGGTGVDSLDARLAMTSTISPWNRPFSIKTVPVSTPAIAPPAARFPARSFERLFIVHRGIAVVQSHARTT